MSAAVQRAGEQQDEVDVEKIKRTISLGTVAARRTTPRSLRGCHPPRPGTARAAPCAVSGPAPHARAQQTIRENGSFADRSSKAGIRRIQLHDTRHTCGSLLAALDVHPRIAMRILRRIKIAVTMEIYTHVPSEATRKALRRLGKHLGKQDRK
ncbi:MULTISPECIES: hypothetical protein [Streptomyces]|uniref:hypothetical protein n=1 Tax=Streptomyces lycopersici TaxID=2974589 RepID=UPI0021D3BD7C|nr:hypothetical protein [Streptomyces sp. NEAU-383]